MGGDIFVAKFQILREAVVVMRSHYHHILLDRDYILVIGEMYHGALEEREDKVDELTYDLENT